MSFIKRLSCVMYQFLTPSNNWNTAFPQRSNSALLSVCLMG